MAILLLETLRLSGSLARHDGVTRRMFFESVKSQAGYDRYSQLL